MLLFYPNLNNPYFINTVLWNAIMYLEILYDLLPQALKRKASLFQGRSVFCSNAQKGVSLWLVDSNNWVALLLVRMPPIMHFERLQSNFDILAHTNCSIWISKLDSSSISSPNSHVSVIGSAFRFYSRIEVYIAQVLCRNSGQTVNALWSQIVPF